MRQLRENVLEESRARLITSTIFDPAQNGFLNNWYLKVILTLSCDGYVEVALADYQRNRRTVWSRPETWVLMHFQKRPVNSSTFLLDSDITSYFIVSRSLEVIPMFYTVKKLAKMSGVSVRTLHYYDEIGLLQPAHYGENKYRYYEKEQLLVLQQILFYRQLGFSLSAIKNILMSDDFNILEALKSHKKILLEKLDRTQTLIKTIDNTIAYLRGKTMMKDEELYYGFDSEKQQQYEHELVAKGLVSKDFMSSYKTKISHWTGLDKESFLKEGKAINDDLIAAIDKHLDPASEEVQAIIKRHHTWVGWNPTKEKYIALTQLYQTSEFKRFYDQHHPNLLQFIVAAMKIFAQNELS